MILEVEPFPAGLVSAWGRQNAPEVRTKQGTDFVSLLYANQILTQK